jgi:hypothetical protein
MQYLSSITSDVHGQIDTINTTLSTISGLEDLNIQTITNLQTYKQNVINSSSKLQGNFIDVFGDDSIALNDWISSKDKAINDINNTLSGKQATITDGSLTIARTSGLQSALDEKQVIINSSNTLDSTNVSYGMSNVSLQIDSIATDLGTLFTFKTDQETTNSNTATHFQVKYN